MENINKGAGSNKGTVLRDQLLTVQDMIEFKQQLIAEIKDLLRYQNSRQEKKWLKAFEIRQMLRLSPGKLQYLRDKGVIPFKKLGGVTYYDMEQIQQLMESETFHKLKLA